MPFQSTVDDGIIVGAVTLIGTDVDALMLDVGDASVSTLTSIYGILGNPTSPVSTVLGGNITMGVGGGSIAANQSVQSMVRYLADSVGIGIGAAIAAIQVDLGDASTMDAASGSIADHSSVAALSRYAAEGVADIATHLGDPTGHTLATFTAKMGNDASNVKDRFDSIDGVISDIGSNVGTPTSMHQGTGSRADDADLGDMVRYLADYGALEATLGAPTSVAGTIVGDIAAVTTAVGVVGTDVGDASTSTLGSVTGILGNPASSISSVVGTNIVLAVGAGSAAADQPINAMVRYAVDALDNGTYGLSALETLVDDIESSIGTISNTTLADTLAASLGDLGADSIATRLGNIETDTGFIGSINNSGTVPDTIAGAIGDLVDTDIATRLGTIAGSAADAAAHNDPDPSGTLATYGGVSGVNLSAVGSTGFAAERTALETASLGVGGGSVVANAREGLLIRYAADQAGAAATSAADAAAHADPDPAGTLATALGAAGIALTAAGGDIKTEVETTTLDVGDGSIADHARAGEILRANAEALTANRTALETASLGIGAGSAAANAREGAIIRWVADNLPGGATEVETTTLHVGDGSIADTSRAGLIIRQLADTAARVGADGDTLETLSDQIDIVTANLNGTSAAASYDYTDAGGEQTILTLSPGANMWLIHSIWVDLTNMTQNGTLKVYYKIDGANYVLVSSDAFTVATDPDGFCINTGSMGITDDLKVTYTEAVDETAIRAIPVDAVYEIR